MFEFEFEEDREDHSLAVLLQAVAILSLALYIDYFLRNNIIPVESVITIGNAVYPPLKKICFVLSLSSISCIVNILIANFIQHLDGISDFSDARNIYTDKIIRILMLYPCICSIAVVLAGFIYGKLLGSILWLDTFYTLITISVIFFIIQTFSMLIDLLTTPNFWHYLYKNLILIAKWVAGGIITDKIFQLLGVGSTLEFVKLIFRFIKAAFVSL